MYVIIAGAGMVGRKITEELIDSGHDVVVVDIDPDVCDMMSVETGAKVINGDASSIDILRKAGVEKADVCLGLLGSDSANLSFTVLSNAFHVENILVRTINPDYREAYLLAGADRALNTVDIYMDSFMMEIEHPSFKRVAYLGAGEASIVIVEVPEDSPVEDMRIAEIIMEEDFPGGCVFAGIFREGEFIVPRGNEEIKGGDRVFLSGDTDSIREAAESLGVK